jgi:general secretion pathway protein L
MTDALLLFLGRSGGFDGWMRLEGGAVAARGAGIEGAGAQRGGTVVGVVPGEQATLRWIDLPPGLTGPQAAAAARLQATELSADPVGEMHVAAGVEEEGGGRCVALVPAAAMEAWLATLAEAGFDADRLVPETLLLAPPEEGFAAYGAGELKLYRARNAAFAAEPDVADLLVAGRPVLELAPEEYEAGIAVALAGAPVDLRQGPFGRRRSWKVEGGRLRRLALMTAALLVATLAVEVAQIARYSFAADAAEAETARIAKGALPRSTGVEDPAGALERRLAELRGPGAGFSATAAALFDGVREVPNVEIAALTFLPDGKLDATVQGESDAVIGALRQRIERGRFAAELRSPRAAGGWRVAELTVRAR